MTRTKSLTRRAVSAALLIGLASSAAACGDDDDDGGAATSAAGDAAATTAADTATSAAPATDTGSGEEAAPPSGEPIKIGLAVGLTGFNAEAQIPIEGVVKGWEAWVNDNGGVDGRPVEVIVRDTQGVATTAQAAVRELVESDGAVAVGLFDAAGASGVGEYPVENNVAVLGVGTFNPGQWHATPNYFSVATSSPYSPRGYAIGAEAVGATSVGIVVCAEVAVCLEAGTLVEGQAAELGIEYVGVQKAAAADPNYIAPCLSMIQAGADFISLGLTTDTWKRLAPECQQQGFDGQFGIVTGSFNQAAMDEVDGATYAGVINVFPWWVDEAPVEEYRSAMETYAPDTDYRSTWAASGWASMELLRAALEGHDGVEVTTEDVLAAMNSLTDESLDGLLPNAVTYTEGEPAPDMNCMWPAKYTAGSESPELIETPAANGDSNGAPGDLASTCLDPLPD